MRSSRFQTSRPEIANPTSDLILYLRVFYERKSLFNQKCEGRSRKHLSESKLVESLLLNRFVMDNLISVTHRQSMNDTRAATETSLGFYTNPMKQTSDRESFWFVTERINKALMMNDQPKKSTVLAR
jgi:hypothetical protein